MQGFYHGAVALVVRIVRDLVAVTSVLPADGAAEIRGEGVDVCAGMGVAVKPGVASHPAKPDKSINESDKMTARFENISFLILFSFTVNKAPSGLGANPRRPSKRNYASIIWRFYACDAR
jgi:hypothetical protein